MSHTSHATAIALLVGLASACHDETAVAARATRSGTASPRRVAVIPKGSSHEFWRAVEAGARRADAEFPDLDVVWTSPAGEGATRDQIALVESCAAGGYDGLCLAPLDGRALAPLVSAGLDRGLPFVIFDSALSPSDPRITTFVASQNRRGGEQAGAELVRALHGSGNVILLHYQMGSQSTIEREDGCRAVLAQHPAIHVVSDDVYAGPDEAAAVEVSESLLATFGDRLDGVFCPNESSTSGFLTALGRDPRGLAGGARTEQANGVGRDAAERASGRGPAAEDGADGRATGVVVVGFDLSTRIAQALESGALHATVAQDPDAIGYQSVAAMHDHFAGKPVAPRIETPQILVLRESLGTPQVKHLLEPFSTPR